ncbi:hypothetical protein CCACVL1_11071 [Corchorus capsularis]|uniref:Uncharacterized protein n=1 Tax=Corchorus capsularis TaxID=210143 RepID=A0A1R3IMY1_COCAP|nr:hypothetical protein CCACVL1_11071 [Corchorus capsularis]
MAKLKRQQDLQKRHDLGFERI